MTQRADALIDADLTLQASETTRYAPTLQYGTSTRYDTKYDPRQKLTTNDEVVTLADAVEFPRR